MAFESASCAEFATVLSSLHNLTNGKVLQANVGLKNIRQELNLPPLAASSSYQAAQNAQQASANANQNVGANGSQQSPNPNSIPARMTILVLGEAGAGKTRVIELKKNWTKKITKIASKFLIFT